MHERRHHPVNAVGVAHVDGGVRGWQEDYDVLGRRPRWGGEPDLGRPAVDALGRRIYGPDGRELYEPLGSGDPYPPAGSIPAVPTGRSGRANEPARPIATLIASAVMKAVMAAVGAARRLFPASRSGGGRDPGAR
ncbi:MAG: hypothetical protein EPO36_05245 [Chloroflexota bacterium]|nr:MAG: hypothetical protein EPO36_05245 [Chloroflexota bacterium]